MYISGAELEQVIFFRFQDSMVIKHHHPDLKKKSREGSAPEEILRRQSPRVKTHVAFYKEAIAASRMETSLAWFVHRKALQISFYNPGVVV